MPQKAKVVVKDSKWIKRRQNLVSEMLPYQWEALNDRIEGAAKSGSIHDLEIAAGKKEGEFIGPVFIDSDIAKFIEAAAYSLEFAPNAKLEEKVDYAIELMELAQGDDGYLNTAFTVKDKDKRLTNLHDWHELYVAGHLLEAAVAYYEATGKSKMLNIMKKNIEFFIDNIGPDDGKIKGYPGHEEIELALVKLYELEGDKRYLDYAKYFIDERGKEPNFLEEEDKKYNRTAWAAPIYNQSHKPVREQKEAAGHAVRAGYLYSGMADVARLTDDSGLYEACETLFDNIKDRQMYITGGIGSCELGEEFSFDYDLPNDTAYTETCAAISLVFFSKRMLQAEAKGKYGDVMERALYNGVLSGMSLAGTEFFYVNPLSVWPEQVKRNRSFKHVKPQRMKWFGCACCPPNLARLIASINDYIYTAKDDGVQVDLFIANEAQITCGAGDIALKMDTDYPRSGAVKITAGAGKYALYVRIPEWSDSHEIKLNGEAFDIDADNGYAKIEREWLEGDVLDIDFNAQPKFVAANPKVREDWGKVALTYGPLVYCVEEADNGDALYLLEVDTNKSVSAEYDDALLGGVVKLIASGVRAVAPETSALYTDVYDTSYEDAKITFVPYYACLNRGEGEMSVWVKKH